MSFLAETKAQTIRGLRQRLPDDLRIFSSEPVAPSAVFNFGSSLKFAHCSPSRGITLIEIIAVVAILGILATLVLLVNGGLPSRAEAPRCMANMRSLQVSLASYLQDMGHWPQEPVDQTGGSEAAYEDWWIKELAPFGGTPEVWQCPSIRRLVSSKSKDGRPKIHYTPTMFDEHPGTPYRWSTQPWLIEIGNMHGHGAHVCFPDGSIRSMDDIVGPG